MRKCRSERLGDLTKAFLPVGSRAGSRCSWSAHLLQIGSVVADCSTAARLTSQPEPCKWYLVH